MQFRIVKLVDGGAYGDVYEGRDALDRPVAIKVMRPSVGDSEFLIKQAQALARIDSPHVVRVVAIDEVIDPDSKERVQAIIMDWLEGDTLQAILGKPSIALAEARRIGLGIIAGLEAIHAQRITHCDLHAENVIVGRNFVKVIDILYYSTLATKSTMSRHKKMRADCADLRRLLRRLLQHTDLPVRDVDHFLKTVTDESSLPEICEAFDQATDPSVSHRSQLRQAINRVTDAAFVDTQEYANALSTDTSNDIIRPLILEMIRMACATEAHRHYLTALWKRIDEPDRKAIIKALADAIDRQVPEGQWQPHVAMLAAFRRTGWNALPDTTRLRLENAIVKDVSKGSIDIHRPADNKAGRLGSYAARFCFYFVKRDQLIANIIERLNNGWFTQNYVAMYFLECLLELIERTEDRRKMIKALGAAYRNDSRILKQKLDDLPEDWRHEMIAKAKGE